MSAYDDAVAYLDAEVHPRCDYDIYSDMRDIVDEMEDESEKLRERVSELEELTDHRHYIPQEWYATLKTENAKLRELVSLMDKRDMLLPCWRGCDADCRFYGSHCERIGKLMGELGFEVES